MDYTDVRDEQFDESIRWYIDMHRDDPWYEWAPRREWWVDKMDEFVDSIERWMSPMIADATVGFSRSKASLDEGSLGLYSATQAELKLGKARVNIVPIGTLVGGCFGCVQLKAPLGAATFQLLNLDDDTREEPWRDASWYLVHAGDHSPMAPFDQKIFQSVLLDILGFTD